MPPREWSLEVTLPMAAVAPYALAAMHDARGLENALRRGLTAALEEAGALDFAALAEGPAPVGGQVSFTLTLPLSQASVLRAFARRARLSPEAAAAALLAWVAEPFEGDLRAA